MMCASAADGIHLQRGREYRVSDPDENPRVTVLSAISVTELGGSRIILQQREICHCSSDSLVKLQNVEITKSINQ